ncbi:MAG TPA: glycosyltransferase [Thermoanaerobaculia bacterium]|nr:glycosyltransferase [Thermoanaerobaculia bacterium]
MSDDDANQAVTGDMAAELDVIIVHYHAAASVREAVAALRLDANGTNIRLNIVIADNGSTPEERAVLQSLDVHYLDSGRNAGYAGAVNIAFSATSSDVVVLMNEDVNVLPGCLRALSTTLRSGASIAGPQFYWDRDCTFLLPCTEERTRGKERLKVGGKRSLTHLARARSKWREHARRHWRAAEPLPTTALSGALLAFRRDTWSTIGPFDEGFSLYFEEDDWLLRAVHAGLLTLYVPSAKAIHRHNTKLAREAKRVQWEAESFRRFGDRYYGERFMRRLALAAKREQVVPDWQELAAEPTGAVRLELPRNCTWPLWIELTPSPLGFPAAMTRITDPTAEIWQLPPLRGLEFLETFYLQLVDDAGRELGAYHVQRTPR